MEDNQAPGFQGNTPGHSFNWNDPHNDLHESEWRHRLITEVITDYVFVLDVEPGGKLTLTWASDNMVDQTGRTRGEVLTREKWNNIIHPVDQDRFHDFIARMLGETEKGELECRSFHKEGDERWIRISARQRRGADGKPTHLIGAVREITRQKKMEQQLLASELKYRKLHSSMTEAFCSVNMKGEMQEFNESYRKLLGYPGEELLTCTYQDLTPAKWHAMEAKIVEEDIIAKGSSGVYEKEYRRKDGKIIPVELNTFLIRDEQGNPSAMWAIVRDITERKLNEKKLKAALADNVTLLREVHHRVKNNLQTVLSLIQMRSLEIHDPAALRVITELQEQIRTISWLYKELFQSERLSLVSMQSYLGLLATHLLKLYCREDKVRLEVSCGDLVLDAEWAMPCGLIVNELVTNALKYAFPAGFSGQPAISVKLSRDGGLHCLLVSDNGVGLPGSVDRTNPSSIGLQLVSLWAKHQMNGTLEIGTNRGTSVTITFEIQ